MPRYNLPQTSNYSGCLPGTFFSSNGAGPGHSSLRPKRPRAHRLMARGTGNSQGPPVRLAACEGGRKRAGEATARRGARREYHPSGPAPGPGLARHLPHHSSLAARLPRAWAAAAAGPEQRPTPQPSPSGGQDGRRPLRAAQTPPLDARGAGPPRVSLATELHAPSPLPPPRKPRPRRVAVARERRRKGRGAGPVAEPPAGAMGAAGGDGWA